MIEWYTAAELAGVPGLPTTEYRVQQRAERETWAWRAREGRGGGREYHLSALPAVAIAALTRHAGSDDPAGQAALERFRREQLRETLDKAAQDARRLEGLARSAFLRGAPKERAESKERVLYVSPAFLKSIVGLTARESQQLLEFLFEHAVRPEFVVRFRWNAGDIAMWDNRATAHLAPEDIFETDFDRQLYRVTLVGDVPVGVDGSPSTSIVGDLLGPAEAMD